MTRARKPTRVLELNGAYKHNPARRQEREREPRPKGPLGPAPDYLDASERERWAVIEASCGEWLTDADQGAVEETCRLWASAIRRDLSPGDRKLLRSYWSCLGMNPADRSKVKTPGEKAKPVNAFGKLAGNG